MSAVNRQGHVLVIGGGVVGLSAAYFCARRGMRVTLVERHPARRDGCSFGNAGYVCPSHFIPLAAPGMVALGLKWMWDPRSPFYIKPRLDLGLLSWGWHFCRAATQRRVDRAAPVLRDLGQSSLAAVEEIAAMPQADFGFSKRGLLMLCRTKHALEEETRVAQRARELGIRAEVLDRSGVAALEPDVLTEIEGAVYFPDDAHLTPDRFVATLERLASEAGAELMWDTPVTGWQTRDGRIVAVRTGRGDMAADTYVLCCGSWSPLLTRGLGLRLPIQAGKGYSLTLRTPPRRPQIPMILVEARVAVTPMGESLRFGGTMEIAGLNEDINPLRVQGIIDAACRYLPDFKPSDFDGVQPWRGLRPVSPDGLPYVGRCRRHVNLIVATGHAMLGLSLGPVTGKLVSQMAAGERPELDVELLAPERYG